MKKIIDQKWLKTYVPIFSSMFFLFVFSLIIIFVTPAVEYSIINSENYPSGLPKRMVAPFVDMTSWVDPSSEYSINGAPNLAKFAIDTNIKTYHLGFINPVQSNPISNNKLNWAWGGYASLTKSSTDAQYLGIVQSMQNLKDSGGMYIISIGGQAGNAPWKVTQSEDLLENFYTDVIQTYSLSRIDLDIEEDNQDYDQNVANAKAIKKVQDKTNVEVSLTIPIMPYGWENKQINIIKAYVSEGVEITLINNMCMCYGTGVNNGEDYGDASVRAMESCIGQLQTIYSNQGIELSTTAAYVKTGCTVALGYESSLYPTFTTSMMQKVTNHAKNNNYGLLSFWSIGRDAKIEQNAGIQSKYAYSEIAKQYLQI